MNKWMNEWINEWMNEWMKERTKNEWTKGRKKYGKKEIYPKFIIKAYRNFVSSRES